MAAQILVVKPKTLTAADKKLLREAGVVCVEATDPASVRMLMPESPPMSGNDLFYAAIKAIAASPYSDTATGFAKALATLAKASNPKEPTP